MDYNYERVTQNIRKELKSYLKDNGLKSLVIGVSGGIDSTVCCALAQPVCDELGIPLIGRSITIEGNKEDEIDRANMVGELFCDNFKEVNLTDAYKNMRFEFESNEGFIETDITADRIRLGNIKARMRMMYLYNIAQMNIGMLLSTDNLTELLVGFWTLHGDVGDYGMVQNLWKSEVYDLSGYLATELDEKRAFAIMSCVEAVPTDGLGITDSDLDQLGAESYAQVDAILQQYLYITACMGTDDMDEEKREMYTKICKHPVVKRHISSQFKRDNPLNLSRNLIMRGADVEDAYLPEYMLEDSG